jgi:hypothetical protein
MQEILEGNKQAIIDRIISVSKLNLRGKEEEIESVLDTIFKNIDYINTVRELDKRLYDMRELDEIEIIVEFKDFILPKSVKIDASDLDAVELLTPVESVPNGINYADFLNAMAEFRGWFRSDLKQNMIKISDLKKCVSWSEIRDIASYKLTYQDGTCDWVVKRSDKPFIPIRLNCNPIQFWKVRYFNWLESDEIDTYLTKWLI